jgi:hypothetical protein
MSPYDEIPPNPRDRTLSIGFLIAALLLVGFLIQWGWHRAHRECTPGATLNQGGYSFACTDDGKWLQVQ